MDFYSDDALSMLGGDNFTQIENDIDTLNNTVVFKSQTQTINGDKTFSGTTTFTGNISANSVDITPIELGYIGTLTSDAQTQLNGKVGISNNETITGDKTFSGDTIFSGDTTFEGTTTTTFDGIVNSTFAMNMAGASLSGQLSMGIASSILANGVVVSDDELAFIGTLTSDAQTQLNGKVSKTLADTISAIKTFSVLPESSVVPTTADQLINKTYADTKVSKLGADTISGLKTFTTLPESSIVPTTADQLVNKTYADTKVSKLGADTISGLKTFTTLPESSVVPTTNGQLANKKYVDDTIVAGAFVSLAGTQTITGNKTFSGTTEFTGNISANSQTITPTELGYIGTLTSDAQAQITARALDSTVVHRTGGLVEDINGRKTFTDETLIVAYRNPTNNIQLTNISTYSFIDFCSGGNADYDVRLASSGGTGTAGNGAFSCEGRSNYFVSYGSGSAGFNKIETIGGSGSYNQLLSHQNYIDAYSDNLLRVGSVTKIITSANTTTYANDTNLFTNIGGTLENLRMDGANNIMNTGTANTFRVNNNNKLVVEATKVSSDVVFIAPTYNIGSSGANFNLLSFQIHGVKNGSNLAGVIQWAPCYNFTSTDETYNYCVPCGVRFLRATFMFDADGTTSGNMTINFRRANSNGGVQTLVHSMNIAYTTDNFASYTQQNNIDTGSALTYDVGQIINVSYSGSPANEWGVVFHGYQYY